MTKKKTSDFLLLTDFARYVRMLMAETGHVVWTNNLLFLTAVLGEMMMIFPKRLPLVPVVLCKS